MVKRKENEHWPPVWGQEKKEKEENERLLPKSDEIKSSVSSAVLAVGFLN